MQVPTVIDLLAVSYSRKVLVCIGADGFAVILNLIKNKDFQNFKFEGKV